MLDCEVPVTKFLVVPSECKTLHATTEYGPTGVRCLQHRHHRLAEALGEAWQLGTFGSKS